MLNLSSFNSNLSSWLYQASNKYGDSKAFDKITYHQLYSIVQSHSQGFQEMTSGKTVAILSDSDEQYALWVLTFFQLGIPFLNLSPNNSTSITVDLIENSKVDVLIYDQKYEAHAIQVAIKQPHIQLIKKYAIKTEVGEIKIVINENLRDDDLVTIFHSSGSTSNPKLIYHSNAYYRNNCFRLIQKINLQTHEQLGITAPLYHAFGFKILLLAILTGSKISLDNDAKCTKLFTLPYHLEKLQLDSFTGLNHIYFSGASLSNEIVKKITENDKKRLTAIYGSTETGLIAIMPMNENKTLDFDEKLNLNLVKYEQNIFEVCIQLNDLALSSNLKGQDGLYHTSDLVELYPDGCYSLLGRKDDLLIHLNGEKTNALAVEENLQTQLGDLMENCCLINMPNTLFNILILDLSTKAYESYSAKSLLALVQDAIQVVNTVVPKHSVIVWDLVYFLPKNSDKNIPFTKSKRNIQRNQCKLIFSEEMELLYENYN